MLKCIPLGAPCSLQLCNTRIRAWRLRCHDQDENT